MCLRQLYERREIAEIRWIDGNTNPADAYWMGRTYGKAPWRSKPWRSKPLMIKTSDDQDPWWPNDLRNDWPIDSCQSALMKPTRSEPVTTATRQ
jgi:hypothetical protein